MFPTTKMLDVCGISAMTENLIISFSFHSPLKRNATPLVWVIRRYNNIIDIFSKKTGKNLHLSNADFQKQYNGFYEFGCLYQSSLEKRAVPERAETSNTINRISQ